MLVTFPCLIQRILLQICIYTLIKRNFLHVSPCVQLYQNIPVKVKIKITEDSLLT